MECECHRIDELLELLQPIWLEQSDLSLIQLIQKLSTELGHQGSLDSLNDDVLIFHLQKLTNPGLGKMPGIAMEYVEDFKSAILQARGFRKDNGQWVG